MKIENLTFDIAIKYLLDGSQIQLKGETRILELKTWLNETRILTGTQITSKEWIKLN